MHSHDDKKLFCRQKRKLPSCSGLTDLEKTPFFLITFFYFAPCSWRWGTIQWTNCRRRDRRSAGSGCAGPRHCPGPWILRHHRLWAVCKERPRSQTTGLGRCKGHLKRLLYVKIAAKFVPQDTIVWLRGANEVSSVFVGVTYPQACFGRSKRHFFSGHRSVDIVLETCHATNWFSLLPKWSFCLKPRKINRTNNQVDTGPTFFSIVTCHLINGKKVGRKYFSWLRSMFLSLSMPYLLELIIESESSTRCAFHLWRCVNPIGGVV